MSSVLHRNDPDVVRRLLATPARWAVVGLSRNPHRVAYRIAAYVQGLGHEIAWWATGRTPYPGTTGPVSDNGVLPGIEGM